jgi:hypothetical protein
LPHPHGFALVVGFDDRGIAVNVDQFYTALAFADSKPDWLAAVYYQQGFFLRYADNADLGRNDAVA